VEASPPNPARLIGSESDPADSVVSEDCSMST
jgi:hypothetical protein